MKGKAEAKVDYCDDNSCNELSDKDGYKACFEDVCIEEHQEQNYQR